MTIASKRSKESEEAKMSRVKRGCMLRQNWWDTTDQCERRIHDIHQALQVPWIPYILQPPRRLWHQVSHRSSHQSIWSTNQILVQPTCWHSQQISHFPSHSNELTLVGMWSMVTTEIATDETWSLSHSKYPLHSKNIYVPSQESKSENDSMTYHV